MAQEIAAATVRISEKLAHLSLSVALDNVVANGQKQEVIRSAPPVNSISESSSSDSGDFAIRGEYLAS